MKSVTREEFLADPAKWLVVARFTVVQIVDETGKVRATISVPTPRKRKKK